MIYLAAPNSFYPSLGVPFATPIVCWLRESLEKLTQTESSWSERDLSVLYSSLLIALQKVVESFPGFVNPQLRWGETMSSLTERQRDTS